jgi:hypothetical protein
LENRGQAPQGRAEGRREGRASGERRARETPSHPRGSRGRGPGGPRRSDHDASPGRDVRQAQCGTSRTPKRTRVSRHRAARAREQQPEAEGPKVCGSFCGKTGLAAKAQPISTLRRKTLATEAQQQTLGTLEASREGSAVECSRESGALAAKAQRHEFRCRGSEIGIKPVKVQRPCRIMRHRGRDLPWSA